MNIVILNEQDSQTSFFQYKPRHLTQIQDVSQKIKVSLVHASDPARDEKIAAANILVLHSTRYLDPGNLPRLAWIHATFAGVDSLAEKLKDLPIVLTNSSGIHPIPISEQVLGYMLMFARSLHHTYRTQLVDKTWNQNFTLHPVFELSGNTAGIVGFGRIGERIAKLAHAFNMNVLSYSTHKKQSPYITHSYKEGELFTMIPKCDFVINCLPLTNKTRGIFNSAMFGKMKQSSYFINIGRGSTVIEKDLIKALKGNQIAGAALDVFEKEPLPDSSPLWKLPNVIITPHYAGWTPKYIDRMTDIFCQNLKAYLSGTPMPTLIDKSRGY